MTSKPDLKDINGLELDRRVWAYDEDRRIAEIALKGRLEGEWEWVEPVKAFSSGLNDLQLLNQYADREDTDDEDVSQMFDGEELELILEMDEIYSWVRTKSDCYLGYVHSSYITTRKFESTHSVHALRTFQMFAPSVKGTHTRYFVFGSQVKVIGPVENTKWIELEEPLGNVKTYINKSALEPSTLPPLEWVKQFLGTPYLWGGRTAWGIDCSGLAQMYFRYQNIYIPRDADQQEAAFAVVTEPRAGDLAFFDGHVGILLEQNERGNWRMLHANSRHMSVTVDTLGEGEYGQYLSSILHGFGRWEGKIGVYWKPK